MGVPKHSKEFDSGSSGTDRVLEAEAEVLRVALFPRSHFLTHSHKTKHQPKKMGESKAKRAKMDLGEEDAAVAAVRTPPPRSAALDF
jgi:hypothetical protein